MSGNNPYRTALETPVLSRYARLSDYVALNSNLVIPMPSGPSIPQPSLGHVRDALISEFRSRQQSAPAAFSSREFIDGYRAALDAAVELVLTRMRD